MVQSHKGPGQIKKTSGERRGPPQRGQSRPDSRQAARTRHPRRRKKRAPVFFLFLLFLLAAAGVMVSIMVYFNVQNIQISGTAATYTSEQIAQASGIRRGQNLFRINKKQVQKQICETLPYLKSADVILKPLSTVVIRVTEDVPALIVKDGSYVLVDDNLKVLAVKKSLDKTDSCMVVSGIRITQQEPGRAIKTKDDDLKNILSLALAAFKENGIGLSLVNSMDFGNLYDIVIRYDKRIDIHVGTESYLSYKLKTARFIIENKLQKTDKGKLDVSSAKPNGTDEEKYYFEPG